MFRFLLKIYFLPSILQAKYLNDSLAEISEKESRKRPDVTSILSNENSLFSHIKVNKQGSTTQKILLHWYPPDALLMFLIFARRVFLIFFDINWTKKKGYLSQRRLQRH